MQAMLELTINNGRLRKVKNPYGRLLLAYGRFPKRLGKVSFSSIMTNWVSLKESQVAEKTKEVSYSELAPLTSRGGELTYHNYGELTHFCFSSKIVRGKKPSVTHLFAMFPFISMLYPIFKLTLELTLSEKEHSPCLNGFKITSTT